MGQTSLPNTFCHCLTCHSDAIEAKIIEDKGTWKYSEGKINNTTDLSRWTSFWPDV